MATQNGQRSDGESKRMAMIHPMPAMTVEVSNTK